MKRFRRRLGTILIVVGVLALGYGATIYFWKDPVTDIYATWKQHQLAGQLDKEVAAWRADNPFPSGTLAAGSDESTASDPTAASSKAATVAADEREMRKMAAKYYASLEPGQVLGRIVIPRLEINPAFVNGTSWSADLSRGPGRYTQASIPGLGKVTAIAGHRTTFGAWFRHIDDLEAGDPITLDLPYGRFLYRVVGHEIVKNDDWAILHPRSYDTLVLSACHPLYSASHRWIVYARLTKVDMPNGQSYRPPSTKEAVAAGATASA